MKKLTLLASIATLLAAFTTQVSALWHQYQGQLSTEAFLTGHENDGRPLYLCRAQYLNSTQIGKTWMGYDKCNISYGGNEILLSHYEVYLKDRPGFWHRAPGDDIPRNAFRVGIDTNGNPLFLCRVRYQGSLQPGKTWAGYDKCNFSYAGKELYLHDFEIYVRTGQEDEKQSINEPYHQCVHAAFDGRVCGYHCTSAFGHAKCAQRPGQECQADNFGNIVCGYHCASAFGHVQCADRPGQNCVTNNFGSIKCGTHCHKIEFGEVRCDD